MRIRRFRCGNLRCCHVRQGRSGVEGEKSWVGADKLDRESASEQFATALTSAAYRGKPLDNFRNQLRGFVGELLDYLVHQSCQTNRKHFVAGVDCRTRR